MNLSPAFDNAGFVPNGQIYFYGVLGLNQEKTPSIIIAGWSFSGWNNKTHNPVRVTLLSENSSGKMSDITSRYISSAQINGTGSIVIYDFNDDGQEDIFMAAHNESPLVEKSSTVFLSNKEGTFSTVTLADSNMAHSGLLGSLSGIPTVVTSGYGTTDPYYQFNKNSGIFEVKNWGNTHSGSLYGSTATTWDMDGDGKEELLVGDFKTGPGYSFDSKKPTKFVIYKLDNGALGKTPAYVTGLRFDSQAYANQSLVSEFSGLSHNYRVWVDDFNHDGKPDVLLAVGVWTSGGAGWQRNQIQMLQNSGNLSFTDVTDRLNLAFDERSSFIDYSMQSIDLDGSGIKSYLLAGDPLADAERHSNYILLNDGTGKLYSALHNEFSEWSIQNGFSRPGKYMPYLNKSLGIDFLLLQQGGNLYNVEVGYKPQRDFLENALVADRNSSKNIRTWAGNDVVRDINSNVQTVVNLGNGFDVSVYSDDRFSYEIKRTNDFVSVKYQGRKSDMLIEDKLYGVELLRFSDLHVSLELSGNTGQAYRVYKAAFNRDPMQGDTKGLGYWITQIDRGMNLTEVSARFVDSNEFRMLYGTNPTNEQFLTKLYTNVLGRQPEAPGFNWWLNELNTNPEKTKAKVLADFAESAENQTGVVSLIGNGITYEPWVG